MSKKLSNFKLTAATIHAAGVPAFHITVRPNVVTEVGVVLIGNPRAQVQLWALGQNAGEPPENWERVWFAEQSADLVMQRFDPLPDPNVPLYYAAVVVEAQDDVEARFGSFRSIIAAPRSVLECLDVRGNYFGNMFVDFE